MRLFVKILTQFSDIQKYERGGGRYGIVHVGNLGLRTLDLGIPRLPPLPSPSLLPPLPSFLSPPLSFLSPGLIGD